MHVLQLLLHIYSIFISIIAFLLHFVLLQVLVTWSNDSSAFVSLREHVPNAKAVVMSTLNCSSIYRIVPYAIHKKMEETYKKQLTTGLLRKIKYYFLRWKLIWGLFSWVKNIPIKFSSHSVKRNFLHELCKRKQELGFFYIEL